MSTFYHLATQRGQVRDIQKPYTELFTDFIMTLAESDPAAPPKASQISAEERIPR